MRIHEAKAVAESWLKDTDERDPDKMAGEERMAAMLLLAIAEIDRLQAELTELLAELAILPKDAECNPVYPGRELVSTYYDTIQQPRIVTEICERGWRFGESSWYIEGDDVRPCYSTLDAAEKAMVRK